MGPGREPKSSFQNITHSITPLGGPNTFGIVGWSLLYFSYDEVAMYELIEKVLPLVQWGDGWGHGPGMMGWVGPIIMLIFWAVLIVALIFFCALDRGLYCWS